MRPMRENYANIRHQGCKTGTFLPKGCVNTRNTADAVATRLSRLDRPEIACSIKGVVAVPPQWTETHSLIRYPSPYGRSRTLPCRPPFFRRRVAHRTACRAKSFDARNRMALTRGICKQDQKRGPIRCDVFQKSCCPLLCAQALQPAVTRSANRPLSALAPVPERQFWSTAASGPALLSVRRAMLPTAKHIQDAAKLTSRAHLRATRFMKTTGAMACTGGFLMQIPRGVPCDQGLKEGMRDV